MDGENNGSKPYEQMDDLGGKPIFLETPISTLWLNDVFSKDAFGSNPKQRSRAEATTESIHPGVFAGAI